MKLSIIIPTLGRIIEFESLLNSIMHYGIKDLEIIVIDQNFSEILSPIILKYKKHLTIHHFLVDFRGLSRAKNFGKEKAIGEIICFIDDDAEFLPNSIQIAINTFNILGCDIVCGRCVDRRNNSSVKEFDLNSSWLTNKSFEKKYIESTMFFKKYCIDKYSYDEKLGIGEFHGAHEGFDLIYQIINDTYKIFYDSNIIFYHPQVISSHNSIKEIKRAFTYSCGFAYVCFKHKLYKKYYSRLILVFLYIPYISIFRRKVYRYYLAEFLGLIAGKVVR